MDVVLIVGKTQFVCTFYRESFVMYYYIIYINIIFFLYCLLMRMILLLEDRPTFKHDLSLKPNSYIITIIIILIKYWSVSSSSNF